MSITHRITQTWGQGGDLIGSDLVLEGHSEQNLSLQLNPHEYGAEQEITFTSTNLVQITIVSDQDVRVNSNGTTGSADEWTIAAGIPFQWHNASGLDYPFAGSVHSLSFHNLSGVAADVEVRCLKN